MANYKVIKNFTDKYNKSIKYKVGDVVEFEESRAKEILTVGKLIQKVKETKPTNPKDE